MLLLVKGLQMPFENRSKEQICSDIIAAGVGENFVVVPEFKLPYVQAGRRRTKDTDIAWLVPAEPPARYRVIATFEIEGFDVPLATIDFHSEVYPRVREFLGYGFPCCIPIYSQATHRRAYGHDLNLVQACIGERDIRARLNNVVRVCDGERREWLREVLAHARERP